MKKKILVVDDEVGIRVLVYDLLSRKGYKVLTAPGGQEAIEIAGKENPDLVLLDIRMPKMDGIDTLQEMKNLGIGSKVVMLTAKDEIETERRARLAGAYGFLRKDLNLDVISRAVDEILEERLDFKEKKKVLIVDDDPGICFLLKDSLSKKGFQVSSVGTAEDALEFVSREDPTVVLMDIKLPGMDGIMALSKIKEINSKISVIMMTGVEDEDIAEQAMRAGSCDYVIKPFKLDHLETRLLTSILYAGQSPATRVRETIGTALI